MKIKKCRDCKEDRKWNEFYPCKTTKDHKRPECKFCHKIKRDSYAERHHWVGLERNYGVTQEQYEKMYVAQNGVCAICEKINLDGKRLFVDHDHSSGKVRGLLCLGCNMAIGVFEKDISLFYRAADYVEGFPTRLGVLRP